MLVFHRLTFLRKKLRETGSAPTAPNPKDAMTADVQRLTSDLAAADPVTRTQAAEEISRLGPEAAAVRVSGIGFSDANQKTLGDAVHGCSREVPPAMSRGCGRFCAWWRACCGLSIGGNYLSVVINLAGA